MLPPLKNCTSQDEVASVAANANAVGMATYPISLRNLSGLLRIWLLSPRLNSIAVIDIAGSKGRLGNAAEDGIDLGGNSRSSDSTRTQRADEQDRNHCSGIVVQDACSDSWRGA